jgi:demethylmenaquinone methyltransferase/2-methoxy-6-polyprenyl-1,4-benzoquinol methylase
MAFGKETIARIYTKRAKGYDFSANLYYLLGFREFAYRKKAVEALQLRPGDTVVEIGCGTGLNFPLLQAKIGSSGRIIGVDMTTAMLVKARQRAKRHGWLNVTFVNEDAAAFTFPGSVEGVLSTFALTLVPEYDAVIQRAAAALAPGKHMVVMDFKRADKWPESLVRLFVMLTRPFAVTLDLAERRPWLSMQRYLKAVRLEELYFGGAYICTAESRRSKSVINQ